MVVQFASPIYLLLLIPLGYYTWRLTRGSLADMSRFRARLAFGLRIFIVAMLVLALAGPRMVRNASQQCVVFVLDASDSIPKAKQDAAIRYINASLKEMKGNQKAGVIVFGADASVEFAPSRINKIDRIYSVPDTSNTDISQALGLALASFPEACAKKIVLFTDGNETMGQSIEQAALAESEDVSISVVPLENELAHEVLIDRMTCQPNVKIGEPFDLQIVAVAKQPSTALLRILRNGVPAGTKQLELPKSKSIVRFPQSITKPGNYEFRAIIESPSDTCAQNNTGIAYTMVKGKPKVLYVEGQPGQSKYLAAAAKTSDIEMEVRDRAGVPTSPAELRGYDSIVLSDIPAWNLAPEQMEMIRTGVKDLGIGFAMIGGENSFGAGGYYDTPIERALPVDMSVRKQKILPSVSVVIVMDKSGSMAMIEDGRQKIELANDAAASVVKLLQPIDKVAVIVCHSEPSIAVELQPAANKNPIYGEISTIRAEGGGIMIFPSMRMANEVISKSNTRIKHVILLADGDDCDEQDGVIPLVKDMSSRKITVTAVAIGNGEHVPFLKGVAYYGKGGFYLAERGRDLKAIFTKDVMTVSKSLIIEEPFTPAADPSSPELSGIDLSATPPLLGYIATSPKPTARVSLTSHKNDPVLASWQYGLGRSAAFTSDCKARWSARWIGWGGYNKFWAQVLRSTMRRSPPKDFQTTVEMSAGVGHVTVDAADEQGNFLNLLKLAGSVVDPDMAAHPITIEQTGPGKYEASFDARKVGTYVVSVGRKNDEKSAPEVTVTSISYPAEYKDISPNAALLRRFAAETSGKFAPEPSAIFGDGFRRSRTYADLWRMLVIFALVALPFDIAVRRVAVTPELVYEVSNRLRGYLGGYLSRRRSSKKREEAVATVGELLRSRKDRQAAPPETEQPDLTHDTVVVSRPAEIAQPKPVPTTPKRPPTEKDQTDESTPTEAGTTSRLLQAKRRARGEDD